MYTIVNDIKCRFTVWSALIITLFTTIVKGQDRCSFQNFIECAKPLSVLTDSGLTFFNSKQDLEKVCPNLKEAIRCIHGFTRHCMNKEDRQHFKELFRGTGSMVHELCREGHYQQEYLKHAPCMTEISTENERCFENYTIAMDKLKSNTMQVDSSLIDITSELKKKRAIADEGIRNVCCAFQEYIECSTTAVRNKCGYNTAEFSRNFLNKMSSTMLNVHCTEYGKRQCGLSDSMSLPSSSSTVQAVLSLTTTVISLQFLLR
ncbi:uncharacterized protein LOC130446113 [Diorhabda sublineata]|uniref:uncharacterized protein LOC130446113 n=1 Tax=Diorhabda sublineata TaxID=1163346 RepID=UPI0024E178A5|nr:uncharacterized protein LOC130446113 [Diorhabda sublineata]